MAKDVQNLGVVVRIRTLRFNVDGAWGNRLLVEDLRASGSLLFERELGCSGTTVNRLLVVEGLVA